MSSAKVMTQDVRFECRIYLQRMETKMSMFKEKCIKEAMQPRWFGLLRPRTREEALEYLKGLSVWSEYHMYPNFAYGAQRDKVKELLMLAEKTSEAHMMVSAEMSFLFDRKINE